MLSPLQFSPVLSISLLEIYPASAPPFVISRDLVSSLRICSLPNIILGAVMLHRVLACCIFAYRSTSTCHATLFAGRAAAAVSQILQGLLLDSMCSWAFWSITWTARAMLSGLWPAQDPKARCGRITALPDHLHRLKSRTAESVWRSSRRNTSAILLRDLCLQARLL